MDLHKAVESESLDDVKTAIICGADINQRDSSGLTPLMHAVVNGSEYIVRFLCGNNATLNVQTHTYKDTAVSLAAECNRTSCLKILLEYGADVSLKTSSGERALHLAMSKGNNVCVQYLKGYITKNIYKTNKANALWRAVYSKSLGDVKTAVDSGVNINQQDSLGMTPLMCAVKFGSEHIVKLLCENNADINKQNQISGETAVYVAAKCNQLSCLKILLNYGADISLRTSFTLDVAIRKENNECVEILKKHAASKARDILEFYI